MERHITIALSRQMGSGGALVGKNAAERLGFSYMNREILRQAAACLHEDENILSVREERVSTFLDNLLDSLCICAPEGGYSPPPIRPVHNRELFVTETEIIRSIAARCDAVIVGRGAFHILHGNPDLVTVFIHAPLEFRCRRVMEIYGIPSAGEAEDIVLDSDRQRSRFIRTIADVDGNDARNYHISIDTSVSGFDLATDIIVGLARRLRERAGNGG